MIRPFLNVSIAIAIASVVFASQVLAQTIAPAVVFECSNNHETMIDPPMTSTIVLKVFLDADGLKTTETGMSGVTDRPTTVQEFPYHEARDMRGVVETVMETTLPAASRADIAKVRLYDAGDLTMDLDATRAIEFLSADGSVLTKGMFFALMGPYKCD